jgi:DEAD/DEAH box helicase domain-containing protein
VHGVTTVAQEPTDLLHRLLAGRDPQCLTHLEIVEARLGSRADWPAWIPVELRSAFAGRGITAPWRHQVAAADLARSGQHVVVATGTASGKSLAYQMPALSTLLADPRATVLYVAPTKALAADQLRAVVSLELPGVRPACFDGDTTRDERDWVR